MRVDVCSVMQRFADVGDRLGNAWRAQINGKSQLAVRLIAYSLYHTIY